MFLVKNLTNMKKITLALSSLLLIQFAHAQVLKGSLFMGGSVNVNSQKNDNNLGAYSKNSGWSVSPQSGKAFQENKVIGIQLFAGGNTTENYFGSANSSKIKSNNYGVGLFYRQYFPIHPKWMLFGQADVTANFGDGEVITQGIRGSKSRIWGTGLGITPGITYQVSKKIWLEASLNSLLSIIYSSQKTDNVDASGTVTSTANQKAFSGNANVNGFSNISIGIRWIIPKS
jgi:hypothetical protein